MQLVKPKAAASAVRAEMMVCMSHIHSLRF